MSTIAIESLPMTSQRDKLVRKELDEYFQRMRELGRSAVPRVRPDDYDRFYNKAKHANPSIKVLGLTYSGLRLIRGQT